MRRGVTGIVLMSVIAMMAIGSISALAGPVQSVTACLKTVPGEPLGTAVYSWWDDETSRLEITVAGAVPGTYCVFVDKVKLDVKVIVDDAGAGALRLDTRWGDVIPVIEAGSVISMKNCADTTIVICGMFK